MEKNGSPYATIETDEDRTFFLIDIPCHPDFLKVEEVVTTLYLPVSTLYQAWVSAMKEVTKKSPTDSPKRILTLCINLVSTSARGYQILEEIRLLRVNMEVIDYIVGINFNEKSNGTI